jgi:NAD(P)H-hydrate epimerase
MAIDCCVAVYDVPDDELDRELTSADAVIDAVLGYRGDGPPLDGVLWLVDRVGRASVPVISLDLPSGVDPDGGEVPGAAVTATATLTLALPKRGLLVGEGRERAGRVFLADLGLPDALYRRLGIKTDVLFAGGPIVRLEGEA